MYALLYRFIGTGFWAKRLLLLLYVYAVVNIGSRGVFALRVDARIVGVFTIVWFVAYVTI